jgi:hypothetical protein
MKRLLFIVALAITPLVALSELYSFYSITENDSSGFAQFVGESQLYMDVTLLGMGQASLVFTNAGPEESTVTRIYFDYIPELSLSLVAINDGAGVEFSAGRINPNNLPAGLSLTDNFISEMAVAANNPSPRHGLNPYDSLELIVNYDASYDFLDALGSEDLRVGLHVQSFEGGYSESFVNVVPEPATMPLLLLGSSALRWLRVKKSRRGRQGGNFTPCRETGEANELLWVEIHAKKDRRRMPLTRCEAAVRQAVS